MEQEYTTEESYDYGQGEFETVYPKFDLTDADGNPIRDARHYPFVSRVISSANREIASNYKYIHFEEIE